MISNHARHALGTILTLAIALTLSSCFPNGGAIASVTIDGGNRSTGIGDPLTLSATVVSTGTANDTVTWTSSDEAVATTETDGQLTSLTAGTTNITATSTHDTTKHDTITLTVTEASGVTSVIIDGGNQSTGTGDPLTLNATVTTTGTASSTVTWTSSNETVATIDANGQVTSLTEGTSNITAASTHDATTHDTITLTVTTAPGTLGWTRQFGTSSGDNANGVATDANGNVYVGGNTGGDLEGTSAGFRDVFVRSYDSDGTHRWTRQFGTVSNDESISGVATDANGHVYVSGYTGGSLEGTSAGRFDAFVRSYDSDGTHRWTRQFGTSPDDVATGVATDANGHVYVSGYTGGQLEGTYTGSADAFVRSYDSDGTHRWTRQFGSGGFEGAYGVATDANGHVYVTGFTTGSLEGASAGREDIFVRSYDSDGTHRWTRQFGTSSTEYANDVATDANGNVYVSGSTYGAFEGTNAGSVDAFVRTYDSDGTHRWTRQFGTSSGDYATSVATGANGNVYVSGATRGDLEGTNAGSEDAFVRSYDSDGTLRWTRQFGTIANDVPAGIATDASGNAYAAGYTAGDLEGTSAGNNDAFVRRFAQ